MSPGFGLSRSRTSHGITVWLLTEILENAVDRRDLPCSSGGLGGLDVLDCVPVHSVPQTAIPAERARGDCMKRYLIFAALVPLLGGFLLLLATTVTSGYWTETDLAEVAKFLAAFVKTLQYSYLFGVVPALIIAAIDDILFHVKRLGWVVRILIVGVIAFTAAELLYGSRGPDTGTTQFILYGLVGFIPATISCWWAHLVETPALA